MSNNNVRNFLERLASDSAFQQQFRADREAVLADITLDEAERVALAAIDADQLISTLELATPHNLNPNSHDAAGNGIANPGIANPGIANPGIANPKVARSAGIVRSTGMVQEP